MDQPTNIINGIKGSLLSPGLASRLNGIGEYYFSQKLRQIDELNKQGKNVINLGIGSPDLPPHTSVIETLVEESGKPNVHAYQNYKGSPVLRNAIRDWYQKWYGVHLNAEKRNSTADWL
jgi:aspartate/methionine/tyrosine aminotransferase